MSLIFHISTREAWQSDTDETEYAPEMFDREGFIHCSTRDQVVPVANRIFKGQRGLLLLSIDPDRVKPKIVYENLEGGEELFPHIYGKLNRAAVVAIDDFNPEPDGSFSFPRPSALQKNR